MKLFAIEGNILSFDGGSMFGNAPKELWKNWIAVDEKNRIPLASRALLIQTDDGRNVLFEVGIGAFFDPKLKERYGITENEHMLLKNLAAKGFHEEDIYAVVLSHLHFDHAGGLLSAYHDGPLRLLFPNATYYVGQEHWNRACSPHIRDKASFIPILHQLLEASGRLVLMKGTSHPDLDFGVTFRYSQGHTVGMMLAEIIAPPGPIVFVSDLIPGMPWMNLPVTMGYDRFTELVVDEKAQLLSYLADHNGLAFFTHDINTPCIRIIKDSTGKYSGLPIVI